MTEKTKSIVIISIANGLISFGYGISIPFLALYLSTQKGVPSGVIGLMLALAMLTTAIASAISGEVSDAFGRKRVMMYSLFMRSISILMIAVSIYLDWHYSWPIAFHFAGSFLGAFFRPASNAWIADNTTAAERVKAFGYMRIGLNLGWCLGPALGGFLAKISYSSGFFITAAVFFLSLVYVQRNIKETATKAVGRKTNFVDMILQLKDGVLARLCAYNFLISMVLSQLVVGLSLHAVNRLGMTENMVGMFFSIQGLSVVVLQYPVTKVISKMPLTAALSLGCVLYAIGFGSIGFFISFAGIALGVILSAVGEMCVLPAGHSLASNIAPDNKRGRYLGLYILSNQAGVSAGVLFAGIMMEHLSPIYPPLPWLIVGALGLIAAVFFWSLKRFLTPAQNGIKPRQSVPIIKQIPS